MSEVAPAEVEARYQAESARLLARLSRDVCGLVGALGLDLMPSAVIDPWTVRGRGCPAGGRHLSPSAKVAVVWKCRGPLAGKWRCRFCGKRGDLLDAVAWVHGLRRRRDLPAVLGLAARLLNQLGRAAPAAGVP